MPRNGADDTLKSILGQANDAWSKLLKELDEDIRHIQEVSWKYQEKLIFDEAT